MVCENRLNRPRNAKYFLTPLSNKVIEFYIRQTILRNIGCENTRMIYVCLPRCGQTMTRLFEEHNSSRKKNFQLTKLCAYNSLEKNTAHTLSDKEVTNNN